MSPEAATVRPADGAHRMLGLVVESCSHPRDVHPFMRKRQGLDAEWSKIHKFKQSAAKVMFNVPDAP